jgi:hypothetical protein
MLLIPELAGRAGAISAKAAAGPHSQCLRRQAIGSAGPHGRHIARSTAIDSEGASKRTKPVAHRPARDKPFGNLFRA